MNVYEQIGHLQEIHGPESILYDIFWFKFLLGDLNEDDHVSYGGLLIAAFVRTQLKQNQF